MTARRRFLAQMEQIVPWAELLAVLQPFYPQVGPHGGRLPIPWRPCCGPTSCSCGTPAVIKAQGTQDDLLDIIPFRAFSKIDALAQRELWIRSHRGLGKVPVMLTLLVLSSSLQCTTKSSNFSLWEEKVVFLASWGGLLISRRIVLTEMLPPNPGVLIHNWR